MIKITLKSVVNITIQNIVNSIKMIVNIVITIKKLIVSDEFLILTNLPYYKEKIFAVLLFSFACVIVQGSSCELIGVLDFGVVLKILLAVNHPPVEEVLYFLK